MQALTSFETACWLYERRRFAEAAAALTDVLVQKPDYAAAHALLALCQWSLKQFSLAKHHAERAVELEPGNPENHFLLSRVLTSLFDWEYVVAYARDGQKKIVCKAVANPSSMKALQAIQEAIALDPKNPSYHAHLAGIKLMLAKWDEGLEAANRGLGLDPQSIACLHYRARAWLDMEEAGKSEEAVKILLSLDPSSEHGHAGLGDVCLYRRQAQVAERHYLEALRLNPMFTWAERGLKAARRMETGRAFVREVVAGQNDPVFRDPYRPVRQIQVVGRIVLFVFIGLVIAQGISMQLWPGHSLFGWIIKWLGRL